MALNNSIIIKQNNNLLVVYTVILITIINLCGALIFKVIDIFGFSISASGFLFPLSFYFLNVITETYGFKATERCIVYIICSLFVFVIVLSLIIRLPSPASVITTSLYTELFSRVWIVSITGSLGLICAFYLNSLLLSKTKILLKGSYVIPRIIFANALSKLVLVLFSYPLVYWSIMPLHQIFMVCIDTWLFKLLVATLIVGLNPILIRFSMKSDKINIYDINTSYNPLKFYKNSNSGINMYGEKYL